MLGSLTYMVLAMLWAAQVQTQFPSMERNSSQPCLLILLLNLVDSTANLGMKRSHDYPERKKDYYI